MRIHRTTIAATLALVIGVMAIIAGGQVLFLGRDPGYYVIDWLVVYNFTVGVLSVGAAAWIWLRGWRARAVAAIVLGAHAAVMLTLLVAYRAVVAPDSLVAMTIRLSVWAIIAWLLFGLRRVNLGVSGQVE